MEDSPSPLLVKVLVMLLAEKENHRIGCLRKDQDRSEERGPLKQKK